MADAIPGIDVINYFQSNLVGINRPFEVPKLTNCKQILQLLCPRNTLVVLILALASSLVELDFGCSRDALRQSNNLYLWLDSSRDDECNLFER